MILLSTLIDWFLPGLRERNGHRLLPSHERALAAMANCRTENSRVMVVECTDCGHKERIPHVTALENKPMHRTYPKFFAFVAFFAD